MSRWIVPFLGLGCSAPPSGALPLPACTETGRARLVFAGDVMAHGRVKASAEAVDDRIDGASVNNGGYDALFEEIAPVVEGADLAFVNLETPIAPKAGGKTRQYVFDAPPAMLGALEATGFDVVSFANNHVYDQGRPGFAETLEQLAGTAMVSVGAGESCAGARRARRLDVGGVAIAWIGATAVLNDYLNARADEPCVAMLGDGEWVIEEAERARQEGAEIVVLSVHWGVEYAVQPEAWQAAMAQRLIDGGVDVIAGHHPHVLQPVEVLSASDGRTGVVAYSLGNLVSNQSAWYVPGRHAPVDGAPRDGLLLTVELVRRVYGRGAEAEVRVEVADLDGVPLWTVNPSGPPRIRVEPTEARIAGLRRALGGERAEERLVAELADLERRGDEVMALLDGSPVADTNGRANVAP